MAIKKASIYAPTLIKLKNGGFGWKKILKDGSVKYIKLTPKE